MLVKLYLIKVFIHQLYFPLIIEEVLMFEPTETQSVDTLDDLAETLKVIVEELQGMMFR